MSSARVAVLVSGSGRSLDNLLALSAAGELAIEIALVVSDRAGVRALEIAAQHGVRALVVDYRACGSAEEFSRRVLAELAAERIELVVLAGFLRRLVLSREWLGRVLNIHPALLPLHGGKGCYGDRVHAAVLAAGERESGCTVHYVDNEYDHGEPLLQRRVPVLPGDDVHTLAARVFEEEKRALPEAIRMHLAARARAARR